MPLETEAALISRAKHGDRQAIGQILTQHRTRIQRLAHSIVRNPMNAEEVVQDVMMAITNKIDRFRGEANLTTWVHRITVNAALMHRRKDRSSSVVSLDTTSSDEALYETLLPQNPPVDRTLRKEFWTIVWDAVDALDSKYRTVFVLREVDGLSTEETAQALGLKVPAVKSRLHRAREALKEQLAWYVDGSSREQQTRSTGTA